jgi:YceI-like domain
MKRLIIVLFACCLITVGFAQPRYFSRDGTVEFDAGTGMEEIAGINKTAMAIFDSTTGQIEFAVLVKGFEFKNVLMQDHFNENYMESGKYPKAVFRGQILHMDSINFKKTGYYPVTVTGTLELHGVKKEIEVPCMFRILNDIQVTSETTFTVNLEDYKIEVPRLFREKIAKTATIQVHCSYYVLLEEPLKKDSTQKVTTQ